MATPELTHPLNRVAVSLSAGVHVTYDRWPRVEDDQRVRGIVFFARDCLDALYRGDPRAAAEALSKMDDARALVDGRTGT